MPDAGAYMAQELASQPEMWSRAITQSDDAAKLPAAGQRVAVVGCGTSWFMAQSYAALRETAGLGITDAFAASEAFIDRDYDAIIALTRSGTTTEVLELLEHVGDSTRTIAIIGDTETPIVNMVNDVIAFPYADEKSVVQTRFATTALTFLRHSTGADVSAQISDAEKILDEQLPTELVNAEQFSFLGRGWTTGLAHEAALKMREASQSWTESYSAMEYRHGPIAIAAPGRVSWMFGEAPSGLADSVALTGAHFEDARIDPLADLVRAQRVALQRALNAGLDPDTPRNLTRSVVLDV
ncbi:SIS domain-containing protein [Paramicrobacterium agarici]|uniref:Fructoselysine-6-P-deglycase FrlB-like protein n=1 Tax=Paramicrobacterium agarici TaxID=630514 RepID=A0A2A9DZI9_9MICO|nr:sugar isomerase [Microbacterium agarici]PFG32013.1 fructoselysine-6-P-deglycase FrlB-like protein [Microbacterium agarici]